MVLDASAAVELLLNTGAGRRLRKRIEEARSVHAPHLIDLEIALVLRRLVMRETVNPVRAALALTLWRRLDIERHAHEVLLDRIWSWQANLGAYDAAYAALAEALRQPLVTADRRLAHAPGITVPVEVL